MKIKFENFSINTAPIEGVNPLPAFRKRNYSDLKVTDEFPDELTRESGFITKVLPYLTQDRYTHKRKPAQLKSYVLENEFLSARFLPEYGGRLHSLYDKKEKRELLFANPVIQPGNLAIRNAWLSGGIEWNIGNFGHTYTTCDNVFAAVLDDGEGNDFLRIYEFERNKSIFWQADFHLPDGSEQLICHVRMVNPFKKDTTTYWWSNIAVKSDSKTRILASNKKIISFVQGVCHYETLPYIKAMPGIDVTYPERATRAFDYFIQKDNEGESTWEAAAYGDGHVFFERSTAPLYYKKLFAWGNHRAGKHWQEFLSDGVGTGYYAEIQAGIAPSQLHDKLLAAESKFEWTQCFGRTSLDTERLFDENYNAAVEALGNKIDSILDADALRQIDSRCAKLADVPVTEDRIMHCGSGFGALEAARMELDGDAKVPASLCFPKSTIKEAESPWYSLLTEGKLPANSPADIPVSYMVSEKWLSRLEDAARSRSWNALLHYGVALYEYQRTDLLLKGSYDEEEDMRLINAAREAWLKSVDVCPSVWAYRNLAVLEEREDNIASAEEYYDKAMALPEIYADYAIASEYMSFLVKQGKYEKAWRIFEALPAPFKKVDRIRITVATAAVKLGYLDYLEEFFAEEHNDVREGENSLTDIWFEYCARKLAKERGVTDLTDEILDGLIDEAWDLCPPDYSIDFRMTLDRKSKYRVSN